MGQKIKPVVYTVLIAFNNEQDVSRVLQSLKKETGSKDYELKAAIGDNSTDSGKKKLIATICKQYTWVQYIDLKENTGFARGNNLVVAKVANHTDYIFLLNIDTEIKRGSIIKLLEAQRETDAAIVGPLIVYGDDRNINWYSGGCWYPWLAAIRMGRRNQPVNQLDKRREVTFIVGAAMFMPITTYQTHQLFFEPYFMYYEESDYCAHLIMKGEKLVYEPRAVVYHYIPKSTVKSANSVYYLVRNQWLFWTRTNQGLRKAFSFIMVIALQKIHFFRYILDADIRSAVWQGTLDALKKNYGERT